MHDNNEYHNRKNAMLLLWPFFMPPTPLVWWKFKHEELKHKWLAFLWFVQQCNLIHSLSNFYDTNPLFGNTKFFKSSFTPNIEAEIVETTFRSRFRFGFLKYPLFFKRIF